MDDMGYDTVRGIKININELNAVRHRSPLQLMEDIRREKPADLQTLYNGNLRGPTPPNATFPQEIAGLLKGLCSPSLSLNNPLIRPYFLGENGVGALRFP